MQVMTCKRENILQVIARDKFCELLFQFNITKNVLIEQHFTAQNILWQLIREPNGNLLNIATSEIGKLQVIKGVYLQIQGEMMTCTGHKIIQGEGLKYSV